ncbi:MAG: metal ABC transporter permease [Candidatus Eisenbacteria bacterium]|uniref:Metal ABC transporter permease n=1 Tax=Eiseniibacteriota bacterium TaxID=2212470 RepID=A0A956LWM2_UNCEI|nr:metal ABC transporter permease [Candidatus Eisenbacteria bacterium]
MFDAFQHPFFQRAVLAGLLAAVACGLVGSYVVVKRISSISGGLSHAAFGGVGLGYFLGIPPMAGATVFTLLCGMALGVAYRRMESKLDTLISTMWAGGMAIGILFVALTPGFAPDLMSYLFGSILLVPEHHLWLTLALDVVVLLVVALFFKELQAIAFDEEFSLVMGVPVPAMFQVLLALTALTIVVLIRVVGILLVIALLTVPAAIARQWSDRLLTMMGLATAVGAVCTTAGLWGSFVLSETLGVSVPSGPLIILLALLLYGMSTLLRWRHR